MRDLIRAPVCVVPGRYGREDRRGVRLPLTLLFVGVGLRAPMFDRGGASSRAVQSGVETTALHIERKPHVAQRARVRSEPVARCGSSGRLEFRRSNASAPADYLIVNVTVSGVPAVPVAFAPE